MDADFLRKGGSPKTYLAYDKKDNTLFEYTILNNDFPEKGPMNITVQETTNSEIAFWQKFEPSELIEAYKKGQLKGKLQRNWKKIQILLLC
ncbi:hypothetical protein [uncultured Parabacteroides sp.]|nr:hypothetical protein [uncultured Parabacteroides sp.]